MDTAFTLHMAPMQGYTDFGFRSVFHSIFGGIDAYYTPFIRLEKGGVRRKDLREIEDNLHSVKPLIPQIIAATPDEAEALIEVILNHGYSCIDINLGCAFPLQTKHHKGSGLLPYPDEVAALLRVVEKYPQVEFSVKMRLGYASSDECLALLPILNAVSLDHITVHARLGVQQYKGTCHHEAFAAFASGCNHPLLYNGDLYTVEDIQTVRALVPNLSGVMLGRGLLAHPWLALEYREGAVWDVSKCKDYMRKFHAELLSYFEQRLEGGEVQLLTKMKSYWEYMLPESDRKLHKAIHKARHIAAYTQAVHQMLR